MNILLISFEFPPQPGGIGTYSYQIAKNLHYLNNNITALVNTNLMSRDEVEKFDNFQEFNIIRFKNYKNKVFKIIHRIFFSCKVFESKKYDLIFITYSHAGIIGIIGKYLYKIPYIMMGHGSEFLYKNRYLNFFIRLFFNCSDLIFANSKFTADLMRNRGIINKNLKVIPLGADEKLYDKNRYNPDLLKKKYGFEKRQIILTVGNLSIRKGHKYVIEAVQILKDDFPNILYLIIGRGKEREYLEMLK